MKNATTTTTRKPVSSNRGGTGSRTKHVRDQFETVIGSIANIPGLTEQDVHALCSLLDKTGR